MECTLTQPGDKNKKKWEEGAAAKAWGGGGTPEINFCRSDSIYVI